MKTLNTSSILLWHATLLIVLKFFTHPAMAVGAPHGLLADISNSTCCAELPRPSTPQYKPQNEEVKIIEKQLRRLIKSKKGMLLFRSQRHLLQAFDLIAQYPNAWPKTAPQSQRPDVPPVIYYLEKTNKGFHSIFNAPFGLPAKWQSHPNLATLINEDQAFIVKDYIYVFDGPNNLYRLPEAFNKSYRIVRNRRFTNKMPRSTALYNLGATPMPKNDQAPVMDDSATVKSMNMDRSVAHNSKKQVHQRLRLKKILGLTGSVVSFIALSSARLAALIYIAQCKLFGCP